MDWIDPEPAFQSHDYSAFQYLGQESRQAAIIRKTEVDQKPEIQPILPSRELAHNELKLELGEETLHTLLQGEVPGSYLLVCGRAPDVFPGEQAGITDLPLLRHQWESITSLFHVHRNITRTILRDVSYFSATRHTFNGFGIPEISYTARMSAAYRDDLAISTTYIPHSRTNFSVIYGCNDCQAHVLWERIRSAGESLSHPLIFIGIFLELERERLIALADSLADKFTLGSDILETQSWDPNNSKMQSYLGICLQSRTLVDQIRAVKRQIVKVLREIHELEKTWRSSGATLEETERNRGMIQTGQQMKQRIEDMLDEYDDKIDECKMMAENLSLAMQTGFNQIARQDSVTNTSISQANTTIALETKRESAQMRSIALLTMVYLPISCVASIFSTSLFDWNPNHGEPIVSEKLWILFALAIPLTALTLGIWHFNTNRDRKREEKKRRETFRIGVKGEDFV
ncbi:hypothetical protein QBC43DRAFT_324689 [Cladorrhinum sp. PSN259]|nr:hypothetical protein QBC43DRAFT_324689 [Cladorrhinum sp. PSN259]